STIVCRWYDSPHSPPCNNSPSLSAPACRLPASTHSHNNLSFGHHVPDDPCVLPNRFFQRTNMNPRCHRLRKYKLPTATEAIPSALPFAPRRAGRLVVRFEFFQPQLQLFDLPLQLL